MSEDQRQKKNMWDNAFDYYYENRKEKCKYSRRKQKETAGCVRKMGGVTESSVKK